MEENTWDWASQIGHSFRTHDDIYNDWRSIVEITAVHSKVTEYGGPGHWADPGMSWLIHGYIHHGSKTPCLILTNQSTL